MRRDIVQRVVKWHRDRRRQGTHSSKTRAEVAGTGRKPYRQKGTGMARQGTLRAPHMRGGGRVFGPKPRDHSWPIPKKVIHAYQYHACSLLCRLQQSLMSMSPTQTRCAGVHK
jgi:large subunit ribosomal protein L4